MKENGTAEARRAETAREAGRGPGSLHPLCSAPRSGAWVGHLEDMAFKKGVAQVQTESRSSQVHSSSRAPALRPAGIRGQTRASQASASLPHCQAIRQNPVSWRAGRKHRRPPSCGLGPRHHGDVALAVTACGWAGVLLGPDQ